ncbi:hypothetical protein SAMN05216389_112104 [Oceanobacillus limi]|uniref:Uncharacterized protein n=1 Tax=Oceanobacillus limi TaxID=930131 RepID=A0A1I0EU33_9BACI|nr:hypothetical protein [Oceanobacillus limi]SET48905.1 hypothetical protein SAMN05216389_112104 [Oceanobacillus limi]
MFDDDGNVVGIKLNKALETLCEVYNYFLDIYCAIVKHRQVLKLSPHDIHTLDFGHLTKNGEVYNNIRFFSINGATVTTGFVSPNKSVINRLKEVLMSADPNIRKYSLGVNAVRQVFGGEYLSGVVQAVTELESCLYEVYEQKLKEKEISFFLSIFNREAILVIGSP